MKRYAYLILLVGIAVAAGCFTSPVAAQVYYAGGSYDDDEYYEDYYEDYQDYDDYDEYYQDDPEVVINTYRVLFSDPFLIAQRVTYYDPYFFRIRLTLGVRLWLPVRIILHPVRYRYVNYDPFYPLVVYRHPYYPPPWHHRVWRHKFRHHPHFYHHGHFAHHHHYKHKRYFGYGNGHFSHGKPPRKGGTYTPAPPRPRDWERRGVREVAQRQPRNRRVQSPATSPGKKDRAVRETVTRRKVKRPATPGRRSPTVATRRSPDNRRLEKDPREKRSGMRRESRRDARSTRNGIISRGKETRSAKRVESARNQRGPQKSSVSRRERSQRSREVYRRPAPQRSTEKNVVRKAPRRPQRYERASTAAKRPSRSGAVQSRKQIRSQNRSATLNRAKKAPASRKLSKSAPARASKRALTSRRSGNTASEKRTARTSGQRKRAERRKK